MGLVSISLEDAFEDAGESLSQVVGFGFFALWAVGKVVADIARAALSDCADTS